MHFVGLMLAGRKLADALRTEHVVEMSAEDVFRTVLAVRTNASLSIVGSILQGYAAQGVAVTEDQGRRAAAAAVSAVAEVERLLSEATITEAAAVSALRNDIYLCARCAVEGLYTCRSDCTVKVAGIKERAS